MKRRNRNQSACPTSSPPNTSSLPSSLKLRASDFPPPPSDGPVLEISPDLVLENGLAVLAVMVAPENADMRAQILATKHQAYNEAHLMTVPEHDRPFLRDFLYKQFVQPYGGMQTILHSPGISEIDIMIDQAETVGIRASVILAYALRMFCSEGVLPSLNKAIYFILEMENRYPREQPAPGPKSDRRLLDLWKRYKSVAHLWAAYLALRNRGGLHGNVHVDFVQPGFLPSLLGIAEIFRAFATQFKPKGQRQPFLQPVETWRCPDNVSLPEEELLVYPFHPGELAILHEYRAPKRFY